MRRSVLFPAFLAFLIPTVLAAAPAGLHSIDPLASPPPVIEGGIRVAVDSKEPILKLNGALRGAKMAALPGSTLRVIVVLHDPMIGKGSTTIREASDAIRATYVAAIEHEFVSKSGSAGFRASRGLSHFPIVFGDADPNQLVTLAANPLVRSIELDEKKKLTRREGGPLISSPTLRTQFGGTGHGIGVAVIDSGIDYTHSEFGSRVVAGYDYVHDQTAEVDDSHSHGTGVAGIIGGSNGMAPQCSLWALKVFHEEDPNSGLDSVILAALNDAYASRTSFTDPLRVINMSLGGGAPIASACDSDSSGYASIMSQLVGAGVAIFVASGNDGCWTGISHPACISSAIAVGAVYDASWGRNPPDTNFAITTKCTASGQCVDDSTSADQITCYSNSSSLLTILAPSECVWTTHNGGGYFDYPDCFGGTSAATPYSAGVAAQLFSAKIGASVAQLRTAMSTTGKSITDGRNGITRNRIDAVEAYNQLDGGSSGGSNTVWVAIAAHAPGSGGSAFRSTLGILNRGSASTTVTIKLHTATGSASGTADLAAAAHALFDDIVGALVSTDTVGSLEISADQPISVTSRTFNQTSAGTFGQGIDGVVPSDGLSAGQSAIVQQLEEDTAFRSNLGYLNMGTSDAVVNVTLYDKVGGVVGTYSVSIPAGQVKADNKPYNARFGRTNITPGYAKVTVSSGSGIWVYGSVLDNKTSDPTTIAMQK